MIQVVNKHNHRPTSNDFYIGRGSSLGNPYTHLPLGMTSAEFEVETREEAISLYRNNFGRVLRSNQDASKFFGDLLIRHLMGFDINLVCYCNPKECHGDAIKEFIESSVKEMHKIIPMNFDDVNYKLLKVPGLYVFDGKVTKYDVISLDGFLKANEDGSILEDDGNIINILINGQKSNIHIGGWGGYHGKSPTSLDIWFDDLKDIELICGKVEINWANK